ncbi:MAG: phage portal protein [Pseudomonadales bacterium]
MGLWDKAKSLLRAEGSHRGPFYGISEFGRSWAIEPIGDGWQRNLDISGHGARQVPAVYACVMAISRAVAQCYPKHVRQVDKSFDEVTTSAAYRVLRNPNTYQTSPDFLLNLVATALFEGEAFAIATRNDRSEVSGLHILPRGACSPLIDDETREIFYAVGSSPLAPGGTDYIAPARDILHLRFHTPRHPLIGESPIKSAALAIGINVALSNTQAAFFHNMNRPSGIISTDQVLNRDQMASLRAAFEDQAAGMKAGRVPVLGGGLKFQPMSVTSQDAQLVEAQRMSLEDICRVFGVPPPLVGDLSHSTLNNAETLIQNFLSMSLGSYLEHIERAFDRLFGIDGGREWIELDTAALLRTDFAGRVDGLTKALTQGLMTPNEARAREGLSPVDGGNDIFMQRQNTPVSLLAELAANDIAKAKEPASAPAPAETPPDAVAPEAAKELDPELVKAFFALRAMKKVAA